MRDASQMMLASLNVARAWKKLIPIFITFFATCAPLAQAAEVAEGSSNRSVRKDAVRSVPFHKLNTNVSGKVRDVLEHPSYFRRMPSQVVECDPQMFSFLVRRPEVMVNIWQIMGITKVTTQRLNPYSFYANDGVGTTCRCDLIYADQNMHIYLGDGTYDGTLAPKKVTGSCVCILRTVPKTSAQGKSYVQGTMDVFLKLDNFGADLIARSVGPFVSKTADYNFSETAKFIAQISRVCERSPSGAKNLAMRLENCDLNVRREFALLAENIGQTKTETYANGFQVSNNPMASDTLSAPMRAELSEGGRYVHLSDSYDDSPSPSPTRNTGDWQSTHTPAVVEVHQRSHLLAPKKQDIYMRR
jgi:hypothetical protein